MAPLNADDYERLAPNPYEAKLAGGKLTLPKPPRDDILGLRLWTTAALNLNPDHPCTGAHVHGVRGPNEMMIVERRDALAIRFEPVTKLGTPQKMSDALASYLLPSDGGLFPYTGAHCRMIWDALRWLAGICETITDEQQMEAIIGAYLLVAHPIEGATAHGTPAQRYEAALALRRPVDERTGRPEGQPRYLIDTETREQVLPVGAFSELARREQGSSLPYGWLDARMDQIGWRRVRLDGHERRNGRQGSHARIDAYVGRLPGDVAAENEAST